MGSKLRAQAEGLGLTKQQPTILYAVGRRVQMMFSRSKPDLADVVRDYMFLLDPASMEEMTGGGKNNTHYYLSHKLGVYIELLDRVKGWGPSMMSATNHLIQISIFSNNNDHVRAIAKQLNKVWENGMPPNVDWAKMEEMYKIKRQDAIATWNAVLK